VFGESGEGTLDYFSGGSGAPGDIIDNTLERPGAVEMGGVKPVAAPDEADLVARLKVEKQSPAFLAHLNIRGEAAGHRLIYPANAVDAELFDHDFLDNPGFFRGPGLIADDYRSVFFHFLPSCQYYENCYDES
jgi:hypothetical protein